jgi:MFS family permease
VRLALGVVCLAVFLTALDQTVVITAFIAMGTDSDVSVSQVTRLAWIVSGYLLGYVIAMPLMGRVADVYGRRRTFIVCLVIFGVGSVVCALAPILGSPISPDTSTPAGIALTPLYWLAQQLLAVAPHLGIDPTYPKLNVLVGARFLQALGGGALVPVALAVVGDLFGGMRRGLALGLVGAVTEAGGVLGPLWGAYLTGTFGWQWIFWLNLPVVALLLALGAVALPRREPQRGGIDVIGALLFGAAVACLTIGLGAQAGQAGALSLTAQATVNPVLLLIAVALLVVFVLVESRRRWPVVDPALFKRLAFSAATALSLLIGAALIVAMVDIVTFVSVVLGRSTIQGGLTVLRLTALIPVGALAGGWLSGRVGARATAVAGCALTAAGFGLMHLWPPHVDEVRITLAAVTAGLGFGLVIAPISTSALNAVRATQRGSASALVTVARMVGMILGLAALTAWAYARFQALVAARCPTLPGQTLGSYTACLQSAGPPATHQVLTDVFGVAAVLCLLAIVPALFLWRRGAQVAGADAEPIYESYVAPLA